MPDTLDFDRSTILGDEPIGSDGPSVLVAYVTRHGSTQGIAERIAAVMVDAGLRVRLRSADEDLAAGAYDAVVFPASSMGKDLAPRVAARLGVGYAAECTGLEMDGDAVVAVRPPVRVGSPSW